MPRVAWEFWGLEMLSRIGSICGIPLYIDQCTLNRSRLSYARLLVDMEVNGHFRENVILEDEKGHEFLKK